MMNASFHFGWPCAAGVLAAWLCAAPLVLADPDEKPASEAGDVAPEPGQPAPDRAPTEESLKTVDADSHEFVERALDHLQTAFDGMQTARRRIADEDTGSETQKTQERVVKELEELLQLVRKQQRRAPQRNQSGENQSGDDDQGRSGRQKLPQGQSDPQNSGTAKNSGQNSGSSTDRRRDGKSAESQERTDAARVPAAEQARRRQAIKDVWGHLPPHIREAMLNSVSEKYLPKYEDLVKKYYEDLAEKSRKQNGK